MKQHLLILSGILLFLVGGLTPGLAQRLRTISVTTPNPVSCSTITVSIAGAHNCGNATITGSANSIVGNTLYVDVLVSQPFICLPVITPYTRSHSMNNIPAGTYTLVARYYENRILLDTLTSSLTVGSCCTVNTGFVASANLLCPGDSASFQAADPNLQSYAWKVDGTLISSDSMAGQRFPTPGNYTIRLIGDSGSCLDSVDQSLIVTSLPQADSAAIQSENCPGSGDGSISLSVSGGTSPYQYSWSTGDTSSSISQLMGGTYSLLLTDSLGCASQDTFLLTTGAPVVASFIPSQQGIVCPGETIGLTNSSSRGSQFDWQVDGQSFSQLRDTSYTFGDTGTFVITMIATDGSCADTSSQSFTVAGPVADFSASAQGRACPNELITLTNQSLGANLFSWSTGGSPFSSSQDASYAFSSSGNFDITLIVSDGNCSDTTSQSFDTSAPIAIFSTNPTSPFCPDDQVSLNNQSMGASSATWLLDALVISNSWTDTYAFSQTGSFTLSLVVMDDRCQDTVEQAIEVTAPPVLNPTVEDETCPGNGNGGINLSLSGGASPFLFRWDDGSTTRNRNDLAPGSYSLTITDANGCEWPDTFDIVTLGGLNADFTFLYTSQGIQFTDLSDSSATQWNWDFGDGNSSSMASPLHLYDFDGNYRVCLRVSDQFGCADTICDTLEVALSLARDRFVQLKVYPNPTEGNCQVEWGNLHGKEVRMQLYDALGRKVWEQKKRVGESGQLKLGNLPSGTYQLRVDSKGQYGRSRIIIR
jgi:PKD repeat protein